MASDDDYMNFLDKANQDPSAGRANSSSKEHGKVQLKTVDSGHELPEEIKVATQKEEWIYVSDADEPFVGVSLTLKAKELPDEASFAKLIHYSASSGEGIAIYDVAEWDPRGQYKDVVEATRKAAKGGDVRVYKVPLGGPRIEYWVVGLDKEGGVLVGAKTLSVES